MTDMQHMNYLEKVAASDVAVLRHKEGTYMGSWKRRGGVGAFMMLARKWDRLEGMLQFARTRYDIFECIGTELDGADGTPLAEVRDLRQYLMLVEAEMMARSARNIEVNVDIGSDGVIKVSRSGGGGGSGAHIENEVQVIERRVPRFEQRTPENGGQHASLTPWVVNMGYFANKGIDTVTREKWWYRRAPGVHVLEPYVFGESRPDVLRETYAVDVIGGCILDIEQCPADAREYFPDLRLERNMMEHGDLPVWQQALYTWSEDKSKFELVNRAWHVEEA